MISSYQKPKKENANLLRKIYILLNEPESIEAQIMRTNNEMRKELEKSLFTGTTTYRSKKFEGFLNKSEETVVS